MDPHPLLLVVEDNAGDARLLREYLGADYEVRVARTLAAAFVALATCRFDIVLLDLWLPDSTGLDTLHAVRARVSATPVMVLTGQDDEELGAAAMRAGASDYLSKQDIDARSLLRSIRHARERHAVEQALRDREAQWLKASNARAHDAGRRLNEQRETMLAVIESASDAIISVDAAGRIRVFNPAAERIFGHRADVMRGQPLSALLPSRYRERHAADLRSFAESNVTRRAMGAGRVQGLHADGRELELEASISQVMLGQEKTLTAILRDVTERVRAENELAQYRAQLSQLTQQLLAQEKATTRRLAQALHDRLGQTLAAIRLNVDALAAVERVDSALPRLGELTDMAIAEVRQVLVELRPPLLDEQGLAAALDNELRGCLAASTVQLRLEVAPDVTSLRWPADVEYAAFMIAREAIVNALRHADPTGLRVALDGSPSRLYLRIDDDGCGIEAGAAAGRPGHLGMIGMRERAVAIGARVEIGRGDNGLGTRVDLQWEGLP